MTTVNNSLEVFKWFLCLTYTDYTGQSVSFLLGLQASGAMSAKTLHSSQGFAAPAIISMIIGSGCQSQEPSPLPLLNFTSFHWYL